MSVSYTASLVPFQHKMNTNLVPSSSILLPCLFSQQNPLYSLDFKLKSLVVTGGFSKLSVKCSSSNRPGSPGSGEIDSKGVLDAFFLGKAFAEAINERIESTVGELLSVVGRLQAEQQKQVQDFQEDVLERAKRAKEKAAREAMEAQGLISKSTTVTTSISTDMSAANVTPDMSASSSVPDTTATSSDPTTKDPLRGMLTDD